MNNFLKRFGIFHVVVALAILSVLGNAIGFELVRQKNQITRVIFPMVYSNNGTFVAGAAGLDSEISYLDAETGTPSNWTDATNEATEIQSSGMYWLNLTASEMNHLYVYIQTKSSTTNATTQVIPIRTITGVPANAATTDDGGAINVTGGAVDTVTTTGTATAVTTVNGLAADVITAASIATDAIGASEIAAGAITSTEFAQSSADRIWSSGTRTLTAGTNIALAKGTGVTGFNDLDAAGVATAVWNAATASYGTAGTYGLLFETDLTGDIYARLGAPAGASIAADIAAVKADTAAILVDTAAMDTSTELRTLLTGSDTAVSSYAGADTTGTTTLLSRLTATRAGYMDYLNTINGKLPTNYIMGSSGQTDKDDDIDAILTDTAAMDTANELRTLLTGGTTALSVLTAADIWQTDISGYSTAGQAGTYLKGASAPSAATVAAATWDLATSGHTTSGTFGAAMNAAGSAGDPWATSLPGAYGSGAAGYILGTNLNAAITTRMGSFTLPTNFSALAITAGGAVTAGTVSDKTGYALSAGGVDAIWDDVVIGHNNASTYGLLIKTNLDTTVSSRSTYAGGAVASVTGNVGGNVAGSVASVTNGVTVTTNNDKTGYSLSAAGIQSIWDALSTAMTTAGSIGKRIVDYLNAAITSITGTTPAQIWGYQNRTITELIDTNTTVDLSHSTVNAQAIIDNETAAGIAEGVLNSTVASRPAGSLGKAVSDIDSATNGVKENGDYTGIEKTIRQQR